MAVGAGQRRMPRRQVAHVGQAVAHQQHPSRHAGSPDHRAAGSGTQERDDNEPNQPARAFSVASVPTGPLPNSAARTDVPSVCALHQRDPARMDHAHRRHAQHHGYQRISRCMKRVSEHDPRHQGKQRPDRAPGDGNTLAACPAAGRPCRPQARFVPFAHGRLVAMRAFGHDSGSSGRYGHWTTCVGASARADGHAGGIASLTKCPAVALRKRRWSARHRL